MHGRAVGTRRHRVRHGVRCLRALRARYVCVKPSMAATCVCTITASIPADWGWKEAERGCEASMRAIGLIVNARAEEQPARSACNACYHGPVLTHQHASGPASWDPRGWTPAHRSRGRCFADVCLWAGQPPIARTPPLPPGAESLAPRRPTSDAGAELRRARYAASAAGKAVRTG